MRQPDIYGHALNRPGYLAFLPAPHRLEYRIIIKTYNHVYRRFKECTELYGDFAFLLSRNNFTQFTLPTYFEADITCLNGWSKIERRLIDSNADGIGRRVPMVFVAAFGVRRTALLNVCSDVY